MHLTLEEIREKEIVNITDGSCFGFADDIVIDTETEKAISIVIKGMPRFYGIFGREEDVFIRWEEIDTIGKDIILVKTAKKGKLHNNKDKFLEKILNFFFNI